MLARLWRLPFHPRRLLKQLSQNPGLWSPRPRSFSDLGVLNHQNHTGNAICLQSLSPKQYVVSMAPAKVLKPFARHGELFRFQKQLFASYINEGVLAIPFCFKPQ